MTKRIFIAAAAIAVACLSPVAAEAKISSMSGAYDGRGRPPPAVKAAPQTANQATVTPIKKKRRRLRRRR